MKSIIIMFEKFEIMPSQSRCFENLASENSAIESTIPLAKSASIRRGMMFSVFSLVGQVTVRAGSIESM